MRGSICLSGGVFPSLLHADTRADRTFVRSGLSRTKTRVIISVTDTYTNKENFTFELELNIPVKLNCHHTFSKNFV